MYPRLLELPWRVPYFGTVTVYTYGVLLAAAYLLGLQLALTRAKAHGLDSTRVMDLGIYIIISALLGAKLLLLVTNFQTFKANPAELFNLFREAGVFYGGLILAVVVALLYIRRVGLPLWTTCDV
ncbi:MAG TPA: prolipoprotein diacylglyceryl transferase family protein, partial [Vicinamibacterales bacterium]|nr:prolipoprotein diacylglyceryl transferase family protein [Vicinamibacterales bacterium]